ncbi:MurR/RpiR family transcriptional regulator [Streptomyces sp. DSM 41527]|uniref:MurR/RpiR family transcriptional regulator n=1 Tax=Streptomyces mooreae TaxID=3075523 RepID=A0ABU2SZ36_9ACTN|nr:MurR/RpiR family transcriptional regulator [Streptomyces sp. DSM 41527]MDT0454258.1 MurR/RpiR family transcriptional regulator [Streptomyces sp. DSM 41527]
MAGRAAEHSEHTEGGTDPEPAERGAGPGTDAGPGVTVAERVRRVEGGLSPAERKIARALTANYPAAGLESASGLASQAGVSAPTVVRFVARLGFDGYRHFQQSLREEVQARHASPLTLAPVIGADSPTSELVEAAQQVSSATLSQTFTALPEQEFDQAVGLICDPAKRIACFGGRFSQLLAEYLDLHLRLLRPGTLLHTAAPGRDAGFRLDLSRRDVCVIFDFRRYQDDTVRLARHAHERGAKVVLFTDPWLSPVAEFADVVLPARVEAPSPFDSIVAPLALVDALVAAVHARLGAAADERMRAAEEEWSGEAGV